MTCNRELRERLLDLCMAAFFGCNIQLGLVAIHVSIRREEYMAKNRKKINKKNSTRTKNFLSLYRMPKF